MARRAMIAGIQKYDRSVCQVCGLGVGQTILLQRVGHIEANCGDVHEKCSNAQLNLGCALQFPLWSAIQRPKAAFSATESWFCGRAEPTCP